MEAFNVSTFLFINQYAGKSSILDAVLIGTAEVMPYFFMLIMVYLWFDGNIERKKSSFNSGLSVLLGMLTSYVISLFYYHPRPFVDNLGTQLIEHAPDSSFPSDHTTFIFSISVMLLFNKTTRVIGIVLCGCSLISGFSRVFGGVHFPLDILGAILVSIFSSVIVFKSQKKTSILLNQLVKKMPGKAIKQD
ncbi:MAG: undecaprenyl-diphosphatase [Colwellia sp.]|uniref:undecaprenyl-diphosphatase n=1 Tax=Colwellia sp. TaxID=56799 RepID=UPI0025BF1D29|nr:undecaprenyl-diphosphatase [Colwellia sp.]NQZ28741.1 undecaprenyl-diphosphatase [Colwellia sp.]